ncbi:torsin-1A-interacting protein 2 isoform X2 [Esox lucius]|uniref:torsin-1A-interacting protein 2 isoform X2 n=1 Tax=Esox lucius TaxID=8010 RepID=UPI0005773082|nr:torsin-1A-interacting protein 2 isoform X2 [Esox lucius]
MFPTSIVPFILFLDQIDAPQNTITTTIAFEVTHRAPLKRRREKIVSVNGSGERAESSENHDSRNKKNKPDKELAWHCSGNEEEMDVHEKDEDEHRDQEQNNPQQMCPEPDLVSKQKLAFELTHRGPLKRRREKIASVNGSGDIEDSSENDDSHNKKNKPDKELAWHCSGNEEEMDVHEKDEDEHRDQEQNNPQQMCPEPDLVSKQKQETSRRFDSSTKSAFQHRPLENYTEFFTYKTRGMAEYLGKPKSTGFPLANHQIMKVCPTSKVSNLTSHRVNNITTLKKTTQPQKQDIKKPAVTKTNPGKSSGGCMWRLCQVVLVLVVSVVVGLLAFQNFPLPHRPSGGRDHPDWPVREAEFVATLSTLVAMFPGQHSELWRRTRIHLERHLQTAQPTEPVSLMLTAGRRGERTLHCLANRLGFAFASALNTSVLQIDGASKADQDSDLVKLEVDNQLREAFEGDQSVAVIHRFEELPPGSTLIFYRYCDHENAAFKRVFLAFTVLLPEEDLEKQLTLNAVEERVQDFIKDKFVGSKSLDNHAFFNKMDLDKLSGLWSRISHLVLPVAAEESIEHGGCTN